MKPSKIAPFAGVLSIILGAVGIVTAHYLIGCPLGIVGFFLGIISSIDTDKTLISRIGLILSILAIAWFCFLCIGADKLSRQWGMY